MLYTVGIVGPKDLVNKFTTQLEKLDLKNIKQNVLIINQFENTVDLEIPFIESCDLLCFMGPVGYNLYHEKIVPKLNSIPPISLHIRYDTSALYLSLYKLLLLKGGKLESFTPFTIDVLGESEVKTALDEIEMQPERYIPIKGDSFYTTKQWADLHESYYRSRKSKYAFTCLTSVAHELERRQIPVMRVAPTHAAISTTIEILVAKLDQLFSNELKTIAILVKWHEPDRRPKNRYSFYKQRLKFEQAIIDFCEQYEMSLTFENDFQAILYTNQSILKKITKNYRVFSFTKDLEKLTGTKISVGIGMGNDAAQAEYNGYQALKFSESKQTSSTYLSHQNGKIMGPLQNEKMEPLSFTTHLEDEHLQQIAKKTSLSAMTISKLLSLIQNQKQPYISSHQIAEAFDISLRTANRILHKLELHQFAVIVGEEQPPGRGRPRKLYEINFDQK